MPRLKCTKEGCDYETEDLSDSLALELYKTHREDVHPPPPGASDLPPPPSYEEAQDTKSLPQTVEPLMPQPPTAGAPSAPPHPARMVRQISRKLTRNTATVEQAAPVQEVGEEFSFYFLAGNQLFNSTQNLSY